jgi:phage virion morphogenesis protein
MGFAVEIDDADAKAALAEAIKLGVNMTPITQAWAGVMAARVAHAFMSGQSPDGKAWAPLKLRSGQPLRDTGHLAGKARTTRYDAVEAIIGTNLLYAPVHQYGATIKAKNAPFLLFPTPTGWAKRKSVKIPARPFYPVGPTLPMTWSKPLIAAAEIVIGKPFKA